MSYQRFNKGGRVAIAEKRWVIVVSFSQKVCKNRLIKKYKLTFFKKQPFLNRR